jgi:hypothetical protein
MEIALMSRKLLCGEWTDPGRRPRAPRAGRQCCCRACAEGDASCMLFGARVPAHPPTPGTRQMGGARRGVPHAINHPNPVVVVGALLRRHMVAGDPWRRTSDGRQPGYGNRSHGALDCSILPVGMNVCRRHGRGSWWGVAAGLKPSNPARIMSSTASAEVVNCRLIVMVSMEEIRVDTFRSSGRRSPWAPR